MVHSRSSRRLRAAVSVALLFLSGCVLMRAREDQERVAALGRIRGTVRAEGAESSPVVVVLFPGSAAGAGSPEDIEIVDHFVRVGTGGYGFAVLPGEYLVGAFADLNGDGNFDPEEPATMGGDGVFEVAAGEDLDIDIVVHPSDKARKVKTPIDIHAIQARSLDGQAWRSVGQLLVKGEIADLDEPRFGPETGRLGLWQPLDAITQIGGGIYFTEPYDPDRIPVLYVHGIAGYPQNFETLIGALDRTKYQAWFFLYPSGLRLDRTAQWGAEALRELQVRHDFSEVVVVAHSMGGLVSRALVLAFDEAEGGADVPLFVTISTPWGGHEGAQFGVEHSPVILESWRDMAPGSDFLRALFWRDDAQTIARELPAETEFHLLWGFGGPENNTDGTVSIASQQRPEAQRVSRSITGYDEDHTSVLDCDGVRAKVSTLLVERFED